MFFSKKNPQKADNTKRTTLDPNRNVVTLINTFSIAPELAEELVSLLEDATETTMRHLPGFVSANLHVSLDKKHVANYAQWRTEADFRAMLKNQEAQIHMKKAEELANSITPILYRLRYSDCTD